MVAINIRMKNARTEKGISQTELAKMIEVSRQTINMIENGDYNSIREISEAVGYKDPLYFSKAFKKIHGLSPTDYEKRLMNE